MASMQYSRVDNDKVFQNIIIKTLQFSTPYKNNVKDNVELLFWNINVYIWRLLR